MSYRILLLIDSVVAKLLRAVRKHWLAILLLSPIFLCMSSIGYIYAYGQIGRLTDFRRFSGELQLPDTNYVMKVTKGTGKFDDVTFEIDLQNTITDRELKITRGTIGGNPEFSTFKSMGKTYFILKTGSLGNDGAMKFQIYNLAGDKVASVGATSSGEPTIYSSCVYPRLYNDELFFEDAFDCDTYPVLVDEQFLSSVKLSP